MPSGSEDELNLHFFSVVLVATHLGCFPFLPPRVWAEPFSTAAPAAGLLPSHVPLPGLGTAQQGAVAETEVSLLMAAMLRWCLGVCGQQPWHT